MLQEKRAPQALIRQGLFLLLIQALLALLVCHNAGSDQCLTWLLPSWMTALALMAWAQAGSKGGSGLVVFVGAVLVQIGAAIQTLIGKESMPKHYAVLLLAALLGVALWQAWQHWGLALPPQWLLGGCLAAQLACYLLLLAVGSTISGTRAWLRLGGVSLQLTEFAKPLTVVFLATLYTGDWPPRQNQRFALSLGWLALQGVFLLAINELGTLLLLLLLHLVLTALLLPLRYAATDLGLGAGGLAGVALGTALCLQLPPGSTGLAGQLYRIAAKLQTRCTAFLKPETLDPYSEGYQYTQARKAILGGGALGSRELVSVPVIESDYVFVALVNYAGALFAVLVLVLFLMLFILGVRQGLAFRHPLDQALAIGLAATLFLQMLVSVAGCLGYIPLTGVGTPFLSAGGTQLLCAVAALLFQVKDPHALEERRPRCSTIPTRRATLAMAPET